MKEPSLIERVAFTRRNRDRPFSHAELLVASVFCIVAVGWWITDDGLALPLLSTALAALVVLLTFQRWRRFRDEP